VADDVDHDGHAALSAGSWQHGGVAIASQEDVRAVGEVFPERIVTQADIDVCG